MVPGDFCLFVSPSFELYVSLNIVIVILQKKIFFICAEIKVRIDFLTSNSLFIFHLRSIYCHYN